MLIRGDVEKTRVLEIVVEPRRRQPSKAQVAEMRRSLEENGLVMPIGIRIVAEVEIEGEITKGVPVLVYGAARLAAAKELGWNEIDTQIFEGSDLDFKKAEIVENLHRADLTVIEKAEWAAELVRLCEEEEADKPGRLDLISKGGRGKKGGVAQAARALRKPGESEEAARSRVRRDLQVAGMAPEAKEAAKTAGLARNQSALVSVAKEKSRETQVAKVHEIAERKRVAPSRAQTRAPANPDKVVAEEIYLQSWEATKRRLQSLHIDRRREVIALIRYDLDELERAVSPPTSCIDAR